MLIFGSVYHACDKGVTINKNLSGRRLKLFKSENVLVQINVVLRTVA